MKYEENRMRIMRCDLRSRKESQILMHDKKIYLDWKCDCIIMKKIWKETIFTYAISFAKMHKDDKWLKMEKRKQNSDDDDIDAWKEENDDAWQENISRYWCMTRRKYLNYPFTDETKKKEYLSFR